MKKLSEKEKTTAQTGTDDVKGTLTVRRTKSMDLIAKFGCLLLAFVIWYFATDSGTVLFEKDLSPVSVEIRNESGFSVLSGGKPSLKVTVSGKRNVLNRLSEEDIVAYVVIDDACEAGNHQLPVRFNLPDGVILENSDSSFVDIFLDNTTTVSVPISANLNYSYDQEQLEMDKITTEIDEIAVTGPESSVTKINRAELRGDLGQLTAPMVYKSDKIVLLDEKGCEIDSTSMIFNHSSVEAKIALNRFHEIPVTVAFADGFKIEDYADVTVTPGSVRVKGDEDAIKNASILCTVRSITEDTLNGADIKGTLSYSAGIEPVEDIQSAAVSLSNRRGKIGTVTVTEIRGVNNKSFSFRQAEPLSVVVFGDSSVIDNIDKVIISGTVDLSAYSQEGNVTLPVSFSVDSRYQGKLTIFGTRQVTGQIVMAS